MAFFTKFFQDSRTIGGVTYRGDILIPSDFPTLASVQIGDMYRVLADVTDNDPSKTDTGQSFLDGDDIYWDGTNWALFGSVELDSFSATPPITYNNVTGVFGLDYNATNLKLTSDALNTIQDIAPSSSPQFAGLNLSGLTASTLLYANGSKDLASVTLGTGLSLVGATLSVTGAPPTGTAGGDLSGTYPNPTIANNAVTDAKFRQSSGLSVIGRATNTTGNVADITAGNDFEILRRSGTSIGFGSINLASANAVGTSILANANTTADAANTANAIIARDASGNFAATKATLTTLAVTGDASVLGITTLGPTGTSTLSQRLTIRGSSSSAALGPHIIAYTAADIYPLYQNLNFAHDNIAISFDAYYDNIWRSSYLGSNFQLAKSSNQFGFYYNSNVAASSALSWITAGFIDCTNGSLTWQKQFKITDTTDSTSTSTGAQVNSGGSAVAKNLYVGGILNVTNTTDSSSITTGCAIYAGGIAVTKKAYIGDYLEVTAPGSATTIVPNIARFTSGSATSGNIYAIYVDKVGVDGLAIGVNKNTTTGNIPSSCTFITTYNSTGGISIGRGNSAGLPNSCDILIDSGGLISVGNTQTTISRLLVYESTASTDNTTGLTVWNAGAGDATTHWMVGTIISPTVWTAGIDNSLLDSYVIAAGSDLATNPALTISTSSQITLGNNAQTFILSQKLMMTGTASNIAGPHVAIYTSTDQYPVLHNLNWAHDNISSNYDSYFDGGNFRSSSSGSNFQVYKFNNRLNINSSSGVAAGSVITWANVFTAAPGPNAAFFSTSGSFGSGTGVVFFGNRTAAPTSNPSGGFLLYGESGAAKIRGSSGTTTTIANADPHCPSCKTDYVHEWENDNYGYLAVCMNCYANDNKSFTRVKGAWKTHC